MIVKEQTRVFYGRMKFRRTLLIISVTMIAFCLTLYFQSVETIKSVNIDPTLNVQYDEERSHSLKDFNRGLVGQTIEGIIQVIFEKNKLAGKKTRVMEIGAGNGRMIMELKKLFPDVEFYGVNKEKTHGFYRRESFALAGVNFGIFKSAELEGMELPYVLFEDLDFGTKIPYDDGKFDVIYSLNALRGFKYKFELLSEILRVLKLDGVSIHTGLPPINVYSRGVVLSLPEAVSELRRRGLAIQLLDGGEGILFRKTGKVESFPVVPHQPIPQNPDALSQELKRPEMGYNLL